MECPACKHALTEYTLGRLKVDVCRGYCGGIWFDNFELDMVDGLDDFAGAILEEIERNPLLVPDPNLRRGCPRCRDVVLMRHYYSERRQVMVDTCPQCGGIWLDAGELAIIRKECEAQTDKHRHAQEYFDRMFQQEWAKRKRPSK